MTQKKAAQAETDAPVESSSPASNASDKEGLAKYWENVKQAFADATTLDVMTITGDIQTVFKKDGAFTKKDDNTTSQQKNPDPSPELDWAKLITTVFEPGATEGNLKVVAATHIEADGDTLLFVSSDPTTIQFRQTHVEATIAAQKYREGIITALAEIIGVS